MDQAKFQDSLHVLVKVSLKANTAKDTERERKNGKDNTILTCFKALKIHCKTLPKSGSNKISWSKLSSHGNTVKSKVFWERMREREIERLKDIKRGQEREGKR